MLMRIIIAGSRNFNDPQTADEFIKESIKKLKADQSSVILSGTCKGADLIGERFARENGYSLERFPAMWKRFGRAAGPIRNREMVETCDAVICFWDGKSSGSASLLRYAEKLGKPIFLKRTDLL